jgi:hypothetical protein
MQQMPLRPMTIGRVLDYSFQLYRKHFVKLMLLMLILFGPFYLLQNLLLYDGTTTATDSLIDQFRHSSAFNGVMDSGLAVNGTSTSHISVWQVVVYLLVILPISILGLTPLAAAGTLFLVRAIWLGEEVPTLGALLKKSFRRFWPMVGSTLLMSLIFGGIFVAFTIITGILFMVVSVGSGIAGLLGESVSPTSIGVFVIVSMIILMVGFLGGWAYFFIRWGYYLPFVALREDSLGIGRSWNLTKRSFWRLILMYFILGIILLIFSFVINLAIDGLIGTSLVSLLLKSLLGILISPLGILTYTVSYLDLKVRNEGMGLDELLHRSLTEDEESKEAVVQEDPYRKETPLTLKPEIQTDAEQESYDKRDE